MTVVQIDTHKWEVSRKRELVAKVTHAVNALAPGCTLEPDQEYEIPQPVIAELTAGLPAGRLGTAAEIASVALCLASPGALVHDGNDDLRRRRGDGAMTGLLGRWAAGVLSAPGRPGGRSPARGPDPWFVWVSTVEFGSVIVQTSSQTLLTRILDEHPRRGSRMLVGHSLPQHIAHVMEGSRP